MRVKCRQRRASFFYNPTEPSFAVSSAVRKSSTGLLTIWQQDRMLNGLRRFVRDLKELAEYLRRLKQLGCPECEATETLNCHSKLYGNDPADRAGRCLRGQRIWCCDRGHRGGCGRTFSIVVAEVLPRHTLNASLVWRWLMELLAGHSLKAAVEKLSLFFALETFYRLRRKLSRGSDRLRTRLCRQQEPPPSTQGDPLLQTVAHLKSVFSDKPCPPAEFQLYFQHPFLE